MSRRILLIDDEADIREVVQVSLALTAGWQVTAAASGPEGIARARSERPSAILLDVMMPDMDGPATFQELQAADSTRGIPVLLLTAKVRQVDLQRFSELGVSGVIAKPFNPLTLASQVERSLGWAL